MHILHLVLQGFLDAAVVCAMLPTRSAMIGKKQLLYIPVFGFIFW